MYVLIVTEELPEWDDARSMGTKRTSDKSLSISLVKIHLVLVSCPSPNSHVLRIRVSCDRARS